ncbi:hypothetical protein Scep_012390 [Stephania cephalantha]|uniref:Uncharacterized protein n=1 Tax=Stephania cephalantha TaxID=152367 RepID=A0AAP0P6F7_9MAGN
MEFQLQTSLDLCLLHDFKQDLTSFKALEQLIPLVQFFFPFIFIFLSFLFFFYSRTTPPSSLARVPSSRYAIRRAATVSDSPLHWPSLAGVTAHRLRKSFASRWPSTPAVVYASAGRRPLLPSYLPVGPPLLEPRRHRAAFAGAISSSSMATFLSCVVSVSEMGLVGVPSSRHAIRRAAAIGDSPLCSLSLAKLLLLACVESFSSR